MVIPSSTPRLLGSFTWKVPLLGTTDSVETDRTQPWEPDLLEPHPAPRQGPPSSLVDGEPRGAERRQVPRLRALSCGLQEDTGCGEQGIGHGGGCPLTCHVKLHL